jgi:hypothetical protein
MYLEIEAYHGPNEVLVKGKNNPTAVTIITKKMSFLRSLSKLVMYSMLSLL